MYIRTMLMKTSCVTFTGLTMKHIITDHLKEVNTRGAAHRILCESQLNGRGQVLPKSDLF